MPTAIVGLTRAEKWIADSEPPKATGVTIVRKAAAEPLRWIAENAGHEGYVVVDRVRGMAPGHGLDAQAGDFADLVARGVIDPVKVTRSALRNAASIASMVLSTDTLIVEKKEPPAPETTGHGHGHGH